MRARLSLAPIVALSLAAAVPAAAQQNDDLGVLLDSLAVLWTHGDASALAAYGAATGLDLEIEGQLMGTLQGRRATAALRQLLGSHETVSVRTGASSKVVGAEDRAFGEFIWVVRLPGADITEDHRIFIALVREQQAWRISEIRILR